jgi:exodeoxyribonuclease-3
MKIVSWNVNSVRKGISEELLKLIKNESPDIICLQETKATEKDAEKFIQTIKEITDLYPYRYWNDSVKGQAGVSTWSKTKPIMVSKEIPRLYDLNKGRILITEFESCLLLNTYVPNTGSGEIAEQKRNLWHNGIVDYLENYLECFEKQFVWCGDLNVVDEPSLDTTHHKIRPSKPSAGLKQFEKDQFDEYKEIGLVDAYRYLYPSKVTFTWFSPRNNTVAWRLDFFLVSDTSKILDVISGTKLDSLVSDHTWILLVLSE